MSKEMQKWADRAMYAAKPIAAGGPKVTILSCNPDPLGSVAAATMTYEGKFVDGLHEITDEQRRFYLADVQKAKRWAPLEFVNIHFLIEGVTRTFTHQLVRQRTAAYAQESMRFAVKETVPTHLPSSLAGTMEWREWFDLKYADLWPANDPYADIEVMMSINPTTDFALAQAKIDATRRVEMAREFAVTQASKEQLWRREWDQWMSETEKHYNSLIDAGMPAEDCREGLPNGTLTRIHYTTDLRYLLEHCGQRLCTQAQHEWKQVWEQILLAFKKFGETQTYFNDVDVKGWPASDAQEQLAVSSAWQFEELVNIFKPICYQTGKCEFNSSADRYCAIKDRVNGYADLGVPSYKWNNSMLDEQDLVKWPGIQDIPAIRDEEWMNNHASARISQ